MKKKKKVGGLTKIAVAVFAVYATFTMVSLQLQISQKKEEKTQLEQQVEEQQLRNAETEALLESQDSDQYVARIAWAMSPLANGSLWTLLANKTERVTKRIWS